MANSDTKNNVSGTPPSTGTFSKGTGGQNTGAFVKNASSGGAFSNGDAAHGRLGDQNVDYGDGAKFPTSEGGDVAVERTAAKAVNGPLGTKGPKVK